MDKQKAVTGQQSVRSSVLTQRELAAHLYRQGVDGIARYMEILAEETDTQLAAAAQREAELREALEPFAHPDLLKARGGNQEGDASIIFARDDAELKLGDFRRAARLLAPPVDAEAKEAAPECAHVWIRNSRMGWKICAKCEERQTIPAPPVDAEGG